MKIPRKVKGENLLRQPSWGQLWSRVIVPLDFYVAKPAEQVLVALITRMYNGYCAVSHAIPIKCVDRAK